MKKKVLALTLFFGVLFTNAQDKKKYTNDFLKFGIKAGFISSKFAGDFSNASPRNALYFGGLVDFKVSGKFHIQPELLYSMEGSRDVDNNFREAYLDFIRIPIMAKIYVNDGFSLQIGPEIAFKKAGSRITNNFKSTDYGIGIGGSYEFSSGFMFDARYNIGLMDLNNFPSGEDYEYAKISTTSLNLGLGYRF